ncbi:MAG: WG repeat-containing protein, partial [Clostridia bacterium]|nr:WG repeat-containing protein [Clostridia bacterium]
MKRSMSMIFALLFLCCICPIAQAAGYTVVIEPQYNIAGPYYDNVAKVSTGSKWGLIDLDGLSVSSSQWDALGDTDKDLIPAEKSGSWGYIDHSGKTVIPFQFTAAGAFHDGLALVYTEDYQQAYINQEGNICFFSPFDTSFVFSGGAACGIIDDLYGFCDTEGNIIIAPQFTLAHDFHEGYAAVQSG